VRGGKGTKFFLSGTRDEEEERRETLSVTVCKDVSPFHISFSHTKGKDPIAAASPDSSDTDYSCLLRRGNFMDEISSQIV
jgi:hypothetical protein